MTIQELSKAVTLIEKTEKAIKEYLSINKVLRQLSTVHPKGYTDNIENQLWLGVYDVKIKRINLARRYIKQFIRTYSDKNFEFKLPRIILVEEGELYENVRDKMLPNEIKELNYYIF